MADQNDEPAGGETSSPGAHRTPPYIAFSTLLTLLTELKTNGIPPVIDRSVLTRFSGGVQGQLLIAVRALGLLDEKDRPTAKLEALVNAHETEGFKKHLSSLLEEAYPYVFKLDLMTATPSMFAAAFKENTSAQEDVLRKCRTFFLNAAKAAEIPVGPRLANAKFPRSRSNTGRKPKPIKKPSDEPEGLKSDDAPPHKETSSDPLLTKLLEKFPAFDPSWPDDIKAQWFAGFDQFMKGAQKKSGD